MDLASTVCTVLCFLCVFRLVNAKDSQQNIENSGFIVQLVHKKQKVNRVPFFFSLTRARVRSLARLQLHKCKQIAVVTVTALNYSRSNQSSSHFDEKNNVSRSSKIEKFQSGKLRQRKKTTKNQHLIRQLEPRYAKCCRVNQKENKKKIGGRQNFDA